MEKILEKTPISAEAKKSFTIEMASLYIARQNEPGTPEFARDLHAILESYTGNPDPYEKEKKDSNLLALELAPEMEEIIKRSVDPFTTATRIALAGNVIDFAAHQNFNLKDTLDKALSSDLSIDHTDELRSAVENARSILYLGDNAGEIVFDKLFIRTIGHNNVTFAVRGRPVINDATLEDAEFVGMKEAARIISNGYDAPSTIIEKSGEIFRNIFHSAGLIIAKGQGNMEGLLHLNDRRIFFLLMVKCDVIAELLNVEKGSFVVFNPGVRKDLK